MAAGDAVVDGPDITSVVTATVGGLTSLLALFTGVGLTADRLAVVFNGGTARTLLIAALLCAVVSIGLGLLAVVGTKWPRSWLLAVGAVVALVLSLTLGVFAAAASFTDGGRPTLTKVAVVSDGDTHATLSFTVMADGVKSGNLLRAFASWVPDSSRPQPQLPFYVTTLRPNDMGVVNQEVSVLVERPPSARRIRLQVYWDESASNPPTSKTETGAPASTPETAITTATPDPIRPPTPVGAQCGNQADASRAAACVEVVVAAAVTASPTATATATP